jgi:hypothetical protein
MILDLGIGAHQAQVEYYAAGWMLTWVSDGAIDGTLTGQWSNVIQCISSNQRID